MKRQFKSMGTDDEVDSNAAHNLLDDFRIGRLVEDGEEEVVLADTLLS